MTHDIELDGLLNEGRSALSAHPIERVSIALEVLPKLVNALDRVCVTRAEYRDVRREMTMAVGAFREAVRHAQKSHPELNYANAYVHQTMVRLGTLMDRLDRLVDDLNAEEASEKRGEKR